MSEKQQRIRNSVFICIFLGICLFTLMDTFFKLDPTPALVENRKLAEMPIVPRNLDALEKYPEKFAAFYNDHFGFRRLLIQTYSRIMVQVLNVSPDPFVILGKEDWLYLAGDSNLKYYQSRTLYSKKTLNEWRRVLEKNQDTLARQGIHFLVVIAPNKETIYPEYLPDGIFRYRERTRMDQLLAFMRENSDVEILDLRPALMEARAKGLVYDKVETHWNGVGAYVAYREMINRLAGRYPRLSPLPESDFQYKSANVRGYGDLIKLIGMTNVIYPEKIDFIQVAPSRAVPAETGIPPLKKPLDKYYMPVASQIDDPELPRLIVVHDSFGDRLKPLLSQNFQRTSFFHQIYIAQEEPLMNIIEREKPDILIYEFVERYLQVGVRVPLFQDK